MARSSRLPPLNALRAFEAAARLESFARAADELAVTPGAISQQIRSLEEHVGAALFVREGRGLSLTEAGRAAANVASEAFETLERAVSLMRQPLQRRALTVSVAPSSPANGWRRACSASRKTIRSWKSGSRRPRNGWIFPPALLIWAFVMVRAAT